MKEQIEIKVMTQTEILSSLPKNNVKNIQTFLENATKVKNEYQEIKKQVLEEIDKRVQSYNTISSYPELSKLQDIMNNIEDNLPFLNPLNSSYEKTGMNEIIYDISKYYKGNLEKVNQDILEALKKFKEINISLSSKDFNYSPFVQEYMETYFQEINDIYSDKMKDKFEQLYWRCPAIITHIELNLRYLFNKYKKTFDKYIEKKEKEFLSKIAKSKAEISTVYGEVKNAYDELMRKDVYLYFHKFINKEVKVTDYTIDKIGKLYSQFTDDDQTSLYNLNFLKLSYSLNEYKNYVENNYIIDAVMEIYKEKDKYKNASKLKQKEIAKEEAKLFKWNNKHRVTKEITRKDKLELAIMNSIQTLYRLYSEFDELVFNERVSLTLEDNSSIELLLQLVASHYINLVQFIKKQIPDIEEEELDIKVNNLKYFLLNPYNTIINNLDISQEYNIPMIISDKYNLMNLHISIESLVDSNLENLIDQINMIIDYYYFRSMPITLNEIDLYIKSREVLNKENFPSNL